GGEIQVFPHLIQTFAFCKQACVSNMSWHASKLPSSSISCSSFYHFRLKLNDAIHHTELSAGCAPTNVLACFLHMLLLACDFFYYGAKTLYLTSLPDFKLNYI
uniref:Uncharacterized protein n=1 Tax=Aegilops tauschii subsp. strangulata TaxID=200361 RepID=A0A453PUT4_AEGTS